MDALSREPSANEKPLLYLGDASRTEGEQQHGDDAHNHHRKKEERTVQLLAPLCRPLFVPSCDMTKRVSHDSAIDLSWSSLSSAD